jgi:hypothetical protein
MAVFLNAQNGAPITAYNTATSNGKETAKEAARFLTQMGKRGWTQVDPSRVTSGIKNDWGSQNPPLIRLWWWALSYQIKTWAALKGLDLAAAGQTFVQMSQSLVTPMIFLWVPGCIEGLPCESEGPQS